MSKNTDSSSVIVRTLRGTSLKFVGRHPAIPDLVSVITDDGWKTTVQISALEPSDELRGCLDAKPAAVALADAA